MSQPVAGRRPSQLPLPTSAPSRMPTINGHENRVFWICKHRKCWVTAFIRVCGCLQGSCWVASGSPGELKGLLPSPGIRPSPSNGSLNLSQLYPYPWPVVPNSGAVQSVTFMAADPRPLCLLHRHSSLFAYTSSSPGGFRSAPGAAPGTLQTSVISHLQWGSKPEASPSECSRIHQLPSPSSALFFFICPLFLTRDSPEFPTSH